MNFIKTWGGLGAVIGGIGWALFHFWYIQSQINLPDDLEQLYGLPALGAGLATTLLSISTLSLYFKMQESGKGSKTGPIIVAIGLALIALAMLILGIFQIGASWLLGLVGEIVVMSGLAWLSVSNLLDRKLLVIGVLTLLMLPIYVSSVVLMEPPYAAEQAGLIFGLLWIPLGYFIWRHSAMAPD